MESKGSLPRLQVPATVPILSQINPVHVSHPTSWRYILILSSHLCLGISSDLFPLGFPTKTLQLEIDFFTFDIIIAHFLFLPRLTFMTLRDKIIFTTMAIIQFANNFTPNTLATFNT